MSKKVLTIIIPLIVVILTGVWMFQKNKNNTMDDIIPKPTQTQPTAVPSMSLQKGVARITSIEISILESFPVQVMVDIKGDLSDSCTTVDEINQTKQGNTFFVTVTTKRPKDAMCAQVITPFEEKISLDVSNLKKGTYEVNINGVIKLFELKNDNTLSK